MKINRYSSAQSFCGYKNIIANDINTDRFRFIMLSMQLDNEGKPDLSEFIQYKKMSGLSEEAVNEDILTGIYMKLPEMQSNDLFLNNSHIPGDKDLKYMQEILPEGLYKSKERVALRAYTFLADLTKRIMNDNLFCQDAQIPNVIRHTFETLTSVYQNQTICFNILKDSLQKQIAPQKVALLFNNEIFQTMSKFFK